MPRRAHNRVGVEVVDSVPAQKGEEPHVDSSRGSFVDGASQMKASASAQSLEAAKAQRQKELLRKKKAERRAHAKQRAAEKEQRQEEKRQKRELLQMMEEDVPAVEPIAARTGTSIDSVGSGGAALAATAEPDAPTEAQQDTPEVSPLENAKSVDPCVSPTAVDGVQPEDSTQDGDEYSASTEVVPKKLAGSPQPAKGANAAALTIQKALKKNYKKCKTMFRQSPRVFAEEMTSPSTVVPAEARPDCGETATASEPVELRPEIAMDTSSRGPPAECIADASPFPVEFPLVPPLHLPPAEPSSPVPRPRSSTTSSCSSSCSCSDSGSCSSCSCSCSSSSSSPSSSSSSPSAPDRTSRRQRSKRRSRTDRSPHDRQRQTHRHTARTSRVHSHGSSGPPSSLLPELNQPHSSGEGKKYGEVHHYMATRIQAFVRGYRGRVRASQRLAELDQELREEALQELQQEACLKIQSRARGVLVRKKMPISDKERRRRRRRRQSQLHQNQPEAASPGGDDGVGMGVYEDPDEIGEWPEELDLELLDDWQELDQLASTLGDSVTQARFLSEGKLRVFCGTWNMHAKKPTDDLRLWIRPNKYHIVAIGSEECVNSIAKSVVFTSKKSWEDQLRSTLGDDYILVASHALTAIHNIVFVHASVLPLLGNIQSDAIATGLGNQLGNKGGVGVAFTVGATSFAFISSHFDAHQRNVSKRNGNFHRINHELRLSPTGSISSPKNSVAVAPNPGSPSGANLHGLGRTSANRFSMPTVAVGGAAAGSKRTVSERFDRVFWYGDLNYRINGTRRMVDTLLLRNQHDVLYANDQLQREMKAGNVFAHFKEGQLHFRPTYKFDKRSDVYDSSSKQRIPSWTDRVLFLSNDKGSDIELLSYRSQTSFRTSDHRPVSAIFQVAFNAAGTVGSLNSPRRSSSSHDSDKARENHVSSQTCTVQ